MRDLILLSGGLDSSTALALSVSEGTAALALSVSYGQRHTSELIAASSLAKHYRVPHRVLDMTGWGELLPGSALTDSSVDVPHEDYAPDNMDTTVVPNRNATFLMAAAGIAQAHGCDRVVTAVHGGDHHLYPDCRPEFVQAARLAALRGTEDAVTISAPFQDLSKTQIVSAAITLGLPLADTWSCYEGGRSHCGQCGTCRERREAIEGAGITDPTTYREVVA